MAHEACPECRKSGKDRTGDNLARYPDGSAFCFSCGYVERSTGYVPKRGDSSSGKSPPRDLVSSLPPENAAWLGQYLTQEEVSKHFRYSPSLRRHVFQEGSYWEARSVTAQPKTLSHGDKPFILFGSGDPIVVVEDVVSAIKVGRVASALPLFGSHLPSNWVVLIHKLCPTRTLIWLDSDKVQTSRKTAKKMNLLVPCCTIETELDPKCYSTEEIQRLVA